MAQNEASEAAPAPATAAPAAAAPASGSKLVFGVLALCVLNLGGTGFVAMRSMNPVVVTVPAAPPPGQGGANGGVGPTTTLDPFVVNLNEPGSTRYLKTSVELELADAKVLEDVNKRKGALRDELLRYLSSLTVDDTLGEQGKSKIQVEMLARVEKILGTGQARKLFFNEFVVQ